MLKALRLPAFGQYYSDYQQQAIDKSWGHGQYLSKLCEQEVAQRFQTRIRNWTRDARLPRGKSFATLQINELPKTNQQTVIGVRRPDHHELHCAWARRSIRHEEYCGFEFSRWDW